MKNPSGRQTGESQAPKVLNLAINPPHSARTNGLYNLYRNQLSDMYWAEKALLKEFPKMIRHASSHKLAETLYILLDSTRKHINRLEALFASDSFRPAENKCKAMDGLINEVVEVIKTTEVGYVGDAGIISSGQKMEHYGMAGYQVLQALADTLGEVRAASMLKYTFDEKKQAAEVLAGLATDYLTEDEYSLNTDEENNNRFHS